MRVPHRFNPLARKGRSIGGNTGSDELVEQEEGVNHITPSQTRGTCRCENSSIAKLSRSQLLDHNLSYTSEQLQALVDARIRETDARKLARDI
jgi:hypothetical protein